METLASGIIAGLLTTLIVVVIRYLWVHAIQPWYEERIYKDAQIEGRWKITYPSGTDEEIAEIERQGHTITGNITATAGEDQGKAYALTGTFKNLILTGEYSAANESALDRGSFSLTLVNNGKTLDGYSVYYRDSVHGMESVKCKWEKQNG